MSGQNKQFDFLAKVLFLGDSQVGKSCIISRFVDGKFKAVETTTLGLFFILFLLF